MELFTLFTMSQNLVNNAPVVQCGCDEHRGSCRCQSQTMQRVPCITKVEHCKILCHRKYCHVMSAADAHEISTAQTPAEPHIYPCSHSRRHKTLPGPTSLMKGVWLLELASTNLFWPGRLPMSSSASGSSLQQRKSE